MSIKTDAKLIPLIYACSGCSNVAQLANNVAVNLDRQGLAEMSCIAGVGGGVKSLVKKALAGRDIIAIDGCALACAKACLSNAGVEPTHHVQLADWDYKKRYHSDYSTADVEQVVERLVNNYQLTPPSH
ncbi:putative zinc-binding protein [Simiduia curdlanivorans]|uniref:Zinc-binding protein n=1 Tax=Simiduia curdlanivorans TaxID=1492769 RepID=A0ABV8V7I9_9GAMM|nr:putative zinc-binding protein [Simiduia curdlanivorans]MDN3640631.1 putative zinc-binding protein [Simiduia curdlanivorans]